MKKLFYFLEKRKKAAGVLMLAAVMCAVLICGAQGSGSDSGSLGPGSDSGGEPGSAAEASGWGLSFHSEGQAPSGNEDSEYLNQFDGYFMGRTGGDEKKIYLTFDSGYENGYMEDILDVLKEQNVPAAFFVVGNYVKDNPDLIIRMEKEGHIVGNHTMTHPDMSGLSEEVFQEELNLLAEEYKKVTGREMKKYYRPPQGKYSEANLMVAKEMGYKTILWSLAYVDWKEDSQPSREEALNVLNSRIHDGAIVLLHSTSKTNSLILKELIQGWKSMGYTFASLDELK